MIMLTGLFAGMSTLSGCNSCKQEENPSTETETETEETIEELIGEGIRVRGAFGEAVSVELEYLENGADYENAITKIGTSEGMNGQGVFAIRLLDNEQEQVQPEGKVEIELDLLESLQAKEEETYHLYGMQESGEYSSLEAEVEEMVLSFETEYVSLFVLTKIQPVVEEEAPQVPQQEAESQSSSSKPTPSPSPDPAPRPEPDPAPDPAPEPTPPTPDPGPCPVTMYTLFETEDSIYFYAFTHEDSYQVQNDEIKESARNRASERWGVWSGASCKEHKYWDNKMICKYVYKPKNSNTSLQISVYETLTGLRGRY